MVHQKPTEPDDPIKALFAEADRAAPDPPALTRRVRAPIPWKRWVLVPAAAVIVLILGTALVLRTIGVEFQLGFAAGDSAEEVISGLDDDVETLADLNLACAELDGQLDDIDPLPADDAAAHRRLVEMAEHLPAFSTAIDDVARSRVEDLLLGQLASSAADLVDEAAAAAGAGQVGGSGRYEMVASHLVELGGALDELGALSCLEIP